MLIFLSFKMTVKMEPLTSEVVNCIACSCLSLWFFWVCLFKASGELGVAFDVSLQLWQLSGCNLQKTGRSTKYLWRSSKTPKTRQQTKYSQYALQLQNIIHYSMYKMNSKDHYCWHNTTLHVRLWIYCSRCSYFLIAKQNHLVCQRLTL